MNILDAAKYFLRLNDPEAGGAITNMKLQKLCYYAQAYSLALRDKPIFDEEFEAWEHGPVSRTLYDKYRVNGAQAIAKPKEKPTINKDDEEVIKLVWKKFGKYDAMYLRELTHHETPWLKARGELNGHDWCNCPIEELDSGKFLSKKQKIK